MDIVGYIKSHVYDIRIYQKTLIIEDDSISYYKLVYPWKPRPGKKSIEIY